MAVEMCDIHSVAEFIEGIPALKNQRDEGPLFYRGENEGFNKPCVPALYRKENYVAREHYFYNELLHRFPEEVKDLKGDLEYMTFMQHYGFPTRLLDVSESPLVALYFAVEEGKCKSEDGFVYCIKVPYKGVHYYQNVGVRKIAELVRKAKKPALTPSEDYRKVLFVKPRWTNERIRAQQGHMLLFGCGADWKSTASLPESKQGNSPFLRAKWRIPSGFKETIRKQLYDIGIHKWTIFPDVEHLAAELKEKSVKRKLDK